MSSPLSPEESFAFASVLASDDESLKKLRLEAINAAPVDSINRLRLELVHAQHGLLRASGERERAAARAAHDEAFSKLSKHNGVTHELEIRSKFLCAPATEESKEEKEWLFNTLGGSRSAVTPLATRMSAPGEDEGVSVNCPGGHGLQLFVTPRAEFTCDQCSSRKGAGETMYGCRQCDYDLCPTCSERHPQEDSSLYAVILRELSQATAQNNFVPLKFSSEAVPLIVCLAAEACAPSSEGALSQYFTDAQAEALIRAAKEAFIPTYSLLDMFAGMLPVTSLTPHDTSVSVLRRLRLRRLIGDANASGAATKCHPEALARLLLLDWESGSTKAEQEASLQLYQNFKSCALHQRLPPSIVKRMASLSPSLLEHASVCSVLIREAYLGTTEDLTMDLDAREQYLNRAERIMDGFRAKQAIAFRFVDYAMLFHRIRIDRARKQSLELTHPFSQERLARLKAFLSVPRVKKNEPVVAASHLREHEIVVAFLMPLGGPFTDEDDRQLTRIELYECFASNSAPMGEFSGLVKESLLQDVFNDATTGKSSLSKSVELQLAPDLNPVSHSRDSPVKLVLDLRCIESKKLNVYVYEIDLASLMRQTRCEIDTNINLDGLVAHREITHELDPRIDPSRLQRTVVDLGSLSPDGSGRYGTYVCEIIAEGVSSRAIVRKGGIQCILRNEPYGHVVQAIDSETGEVLTSNVSLWAIRDYGSDNVGECFFPSEDDSSGAIVVPFVKGGAADYVCVVTYSSPERGSASSLFRFRRGTQEEWRLEASVFVDREAMLAGNRTCDICVRPSLMNRANLTLAPLRLLESMNLIISSVDADGVENNESFPVSRKELENHRRAEIVRQVAINPRLSAFRVRVEAQIKSAELNKPDISLVANTNVEASGLNRFQTTDIVGSIHYRMRNNRWQIVLLGRTGELLTSNQGKFNVSVEFQHRARMETLHWTAYTTPQGTIDLGDLSHVDTVTASCLDIQAGPVSFQVPRHLAGNAASLRSSLKRYIVKAGETLTFPFATLAPWAHHRRLSRWDVSLVQVDSGASNFVLRDCFTNVTSTDHCVTVSGLAPGRYELKLYPNDLGQTVKHELVVLGSKQLCSTLARASQPVAYSWLTIQNVHRVDNTLKLTVKGGNPATRRVHIAKRHFARRTQTDGGLTRPIHEALLATNVNVVDEHQTVETLRVPKALYVNQRRMDEEAVFIQKRRAQFSGNLLDTPSTIVFEKDLGETYTRTQQAARGEQYASKREEVRVMAAPVQAQAFAAPMMMSNAGGLFGGGGARPSMGRGGARMMMSRMAPVPASAAKEQFSGDVGLDFLAHPSVMFTNLQPDEATGEVVLDLSRVNDAGEWVEITALDDAGNFATSHLSWSNTRGTQPYLDLRHQPAFDLGSHVVELQRVVVARRGELAPLDVGALTSAKLAVFDTLKSVLDFSSTFVPELKASYGWLASWPTLTLKQKMRRYHENASHEMTFFVKQKDPEFFDTVLRPALRAKTASRRTLVDAWALGEDIDAYASNLGAVQGLSVFERALLVVATRSEALLNKLRDEALVCGEQKLEDMRLKVFESAIVFGTNVSQSTALFNATEIVSQANIPVMELDALAGGTDEDEDLLEEEAFMDEAPMRMKRSLDRVAAPAPPPPPMMSQPSEQSVSAEDADVEGRVLRQRAKAQSSEKYRDPGPAHAYRERTWLDEALLREWSLSDKARVSLNAFWHAWAESQLNSKSCLTLDFGLCASLGGLGTCVLLMGALDLPFALAKPHVYDVNREAATLVLTPASECIMCLSQIGTTAEEPASQSVIVGQSIYDPVREAEDAVEGSREPAEFITFKTYATRIVLTNMSPGPMRCKLWAEIPQGAIPLKGAKSVETVHVAVSAFSTIQHTVSYYWPKPGSDFVQFPAHISSAADSALLGYASARSKPLNVLVAPSVVDQASWAHVSGFDAKLEDLIAYISTQRLAGRAQWTDILWRCERKQDWEAIVQAMEKRCVFSSEIWAFAALHGDYARVSSAMASCEGVVAALGPAVFRSKWFDSTKAPSLRNDSEDPAFTEVWNLLHSRGAGDLKIVSSARDSILNDRVLTTHDALVQRLTLEPGLASDELRATVACLAFVEKRISLARGALANIRGEDFKFQQDYLRLFSSFYVDSEQDVVQIAREALAVSRPYETSEELFDVWRDRFVKVGVFARQVLADHGALEASSATDAMVTNKPYESAIESTLETELDGDQVRVTATMDLNNAVLDVKYYLIDVELLFSTKPFVIARFENEEDDVLSKGTPSRRVSDQIVMPNHQETHTIVASETEAQTRSLIRSHIRVPPALLHRNVLIQVSVRDDALRAKISPSVVARYASTMSVSVSETAARLRVRDASGRGVPVAYVKVYGRTRSGDAAVFFKDGYTDLRGAFEYASLNSPDLRNVKDLAILVSHAKMGSVVKRARPPAL